MQPLLFFSRVTFICNVCFLLGILWLYLPFSHNPHVVNTILILGFPVAFVLNVILNLIIIVLVSIRKPFWRHLPNWLVIANAIFLIPQIIFFLT